VRRFVCIWSIIFVANLCLPILAHSEETNTGSILLTIFFKHDQTKTLKQINDHLDETGFWKDFPPEGVEVVSWYVMMGIGQVCTLKVPAEKLREVNRLVEKKAWGAFKTEFYATYDFKPVWEKNYKKK
jgi:hypothetical protein